MNESNKSLVSVVPGSLESIAETTRQLTPALGAPQDEKRREEIRREYGEDAVMVTPYSPNRKQRRAQEARRRNKK